MNSRKSLPAWLCMVLLCLAGASPSAQAADKIVWSFSVWGTPRDFTRGIETMAERVEKQSGGNFRIEIGYGDTLSPAKENLDAIKIQALESAMICSFYHPGKNPVLSALDLPFLPILDLDANYEVKQAYYRHPEAVKEGERWNALWFAPAVVPQFELIGTGKAPRALEDWKGIRIRAPGGIGEALARVGAVPTSVPASEAYTGLERGMFQAVALPFTYGFVAYRLDEISDWYTSNLAPGTSDCLMVISLPAWKALPSEYRQMLEDARRPAFEAMRQAYLASDAVNIQRWKEMGLERVSYTDEERQTLIDRTARPLWNAWVADMDAKGYPGQELLDFIFARAAEAKKGQ